MATKVIRIRYFTRAISPRPSQFRRIKKVEDRTVSIVPRRTTTVATKADIVAIPRNLARCARVTGIGICIETRVHHQSRQKAMLTSMPAAWAESVASSVDSIDEYANQSSSEIDVKLKSVVTAKLTADERRIGARPRTSGITQFTSQPS